MKYVVAWESNPNQTEASLAHAFKVFERRPERKELKYAQMLGRVDNNGGFMVVETTDAAALAKEAAAFATVGACHIFPVLDIGEFAQISKEAMQFRASLK